MKIHTRKLYVPLFLIFIVFNSTIMGAAPWLQKKEIDRDVLLIGNAVLFLISIIALYFHIRGFLHSNVHVFLRSMYASLLIKMFVSVAAVGVYAYVAGNTLNKPAIFMCMALYFIYTFIEIRTVFRLLKLQQKDG